MKKLLVVLMVLTMATIANANLLISVNGNTDMSDTSFTLLKDQTANIDIESTIAEIADAPAFIVMTGIGTASFDLSNATNIISANVPPGTSVYFWSGDPADGAVFADIAIPQNPVPALPLNVALVDNMILTCTGLGDVTLSLYMDRSTIGGVFQLMDTQVIHQIPEPITVALLGLGGLFLRRRK